MVKWMSRVAANRGKSLLPSTIITLAIVLMLIISGPAQAVAVNLIGLQTSYDQGNKIDFQVKIEINDPDKFVPVTNISLNLTGPVNKKRIFALNGTPISGDHIIRIKPVSTPQATDFGVGYGYGYDTRTGYGYNFGYGSGYGYGYGGGGGKIVFIYNVTIITTSLPAGDYNIFATLNTNQNVAFQSSMFSFKLQQAAPGEIRKAAVEIKPETINLASNGKFTAFITSEEFDVKEIEGSTVEVTCDGCNSVHAINWNIADNKFIAKFRTQDLENVHNGKVKFTVTGKVSGTKFEGSDTVKVIDQGNDKNDVEECECDEHVKEHDHEDECDEEHDHEDECNEEHDHEDDEEHDQGKHVKNKSPEKSKKDVQKNNNGGHEKNVIVNNNNININNNSGTININIYNQGSGTAVNQGSNNKNKNNKNGKSKK